LKSVTVYVPAAAKDMSNSKCPPKLSSWTSKSKSRAFATRSVLSDDFKKSIISPRIPSSCLTPSVVTTAVPVVEQLRQVAVRDSEPLAPPLDFPNAL
jgi:hypothetical protein